MTDPTPIPPGDQVRQLSMANPDDERLIHLAVVGDTYTFLIRGEDTAGRYALIDMVIPPRAADRHCTVMISRRCSTSSTARSR